MQKKTYYPKFQCFVSFGRVPGSTSGNVDPDPGSKKIVINSHKNQPKLQETNFLTQSKNLLQFILYIQNT